MPVRSRIVSLDEFKRLPSRLRMAGLPPLFTTFALTICVGVFLLDSFGVALPVSAVCISPSAVVTRFQVYRFLFAPFYHGGIFHILFNSLALYFLGGDFERAVGTLAALYTTFIVFIPAIGVSHVAIAYLFDALAGTTLRNNCAIGISAIIFSLIVISVQYTDTVSFFGLFDLPANVYPFFLLVVLSLLSPGLSFVGHLSGILVGYGLVSGFFVRIVPSDDSLDGWDTRLGLKNLPLHLSNPDAGGTGWSMQGPGLPTSNASSSSGAPTTSLSGFVDIMKSWISGLTGGGSSTTQPFSGQGQTVGSRPAAGQERRGIPTSSRLLSSPSSPTPGATPARPTPSSSSESQGHEGGENTS